MSRIRNYITSSWLNDDSPTASATQEADKSHSVATDLGDVDALTRKMSGLATPPDSAHGDA